MICNQTIDKQNWTTMKLELDLLVASMIKDRIVQHKVLLAINQNYDKMWERNKMLVISVHKINKKKQFAKCRTTIHIHDACYPLTRA